MPLNGSLPVTFFTASCTAGILVDPPTRITFERSLLVTPASAIAFFIGSIVLFTRSAVSWSNLALVISMFMWRGPFSFTVMNGRLIFVVCALESSFFAFSAASLSLWSAILSFLRSTPFSFAKLSAMKFSRASSKSSPPSLLFPFVASTSNTPSPSSRIDTSNVPPPRSYTRILCCDSSLSSPYASDAAVGSLMILFTSRPAIFPASFVACFWLSVK